jgi:hypothetical protein
MPQLGIPCLHFVTYSPVQAPTKNDLTDWIWEPLEDCDYRLVAETWAEYRRMHGLPTPR